MAVALVDRTDKIKNDSTSAKCITIALVNNMPDAALEDTESQFFQLLESSAPSQFDIHLTLYSLPGVQRSEHARQFVNERYRATRELFEDGCDAVIITGTEPFQHDLQKETYWPAIVDLLDWAQHNTDSAILSCLAAHASVLHSDGIKRRRLPNKRSGVFAFDKLGTHTLLNCTSGDWRMPHSRWNEVPEEALLACGYEMLTRSEAGADLFVKKNRKSLFVHLQGHPEYLTYTLLKEYRRDIRRFLVRERDTYPNIPEGYLDDASEHLLENFQQKVLENPREDQMTWFPVDVVQRTIRNTWQSSAIKLYRNWLQYIHSRKATETTTLSVI